MPAALDIVLQKLDGSKQESRRRRKTTLTCYPRDLRGPPQNRWGGHHARSLRGYPPQGRQTDPGRTLTPEEVALVEADLRARGFCVSASAAAINEQLHTWQPLGCRH